MVRVGERVDQAVVSYETRHPALLPSDHWISMLITRHVHQRGPSGVAATTAKIRRLEVERVNQVQMWVL